MDQCGPSWTMYGAGTGWKSPELAQNWPSGRPPASDIYFRSNIVKATLIPTKKWTIEAQSGSSWTMYVSRNGRKWPKMAQNWPSGSTPASDIDFRTDIVKST